MRSPHLTAQVYTLPREKGRATPHVLAMNEGDSRAAQGKKMRQRTIGRRALPRTFRSDPWGILGVGGEKRPGARLYAGALHTRWELWVVYAGGMSHRERVRACDPSFAVPARARPYPAGTWLPRHAILLERARVPPPAASGLPLRRAAAQHTRNRILMRARLRDELLELMAHARQPCQPLRQQIAELHELRVFGLGACRPALQVEALLDVALHPLPLQQNRRLQLFRLLAQPRRFLHMLAQHLVAHRR